MIYGSCSLHCYHVGQRRFRGIVRGRLRDLRRFPGRECREIVEFLEAFVSEPEEDVETCFVAVDEFVVVVSAHAAVGSKKEFRLFPILDLLRRRVD